MGKHSRNKKSDNGQAAETAPGFAELPALISGIQAPFLRDRLAAYIEAAEALLQDFSGETAEHLAADLAQYGKCARLLDFTLSISLASGHAAAQDKITAQKIRRAVENELATHVRQKEGGIITVATPSATLQAQTHSRIGRHIARLFARFVPSAAKDTATVAEADARQLGATYLKSGKPQTALPYLKKAALLHPADADLFNMLGEALAATGAHDEAVEKYQEALRIKPDNEGSLLRLGMAYLTQGRDEEALKTLRRAHDLNPHSADAMCRLGYYYDLHHAFEEAALYYARALKLSPHHAFALTGLAGIRLSQRKTKEAMDLLDKVLRADPQNIDALCVKAQTLLAEGRYEEGWRLHENGFETRWRPIQFIPQKPVWDGGADPGKKLLLLWEQGLGDGLLFARYAALCKKRVGKVYVLCDSRLERLLRNCPSIDDVFTSVPKWKYDAQVSMMSLPYLMGTKRDTVPLDIPYLFVPAEERAKWANRFPAEDKRLRVGLIWSGSAYKGSLRGDLRAEQRNMHLRQLLPLFEHQDILFCSLQMGDEAKQIDELGLRERFVDPMADVKDMMDTAAIIENLDMVVTVDTSVAHLVGALGKPVWVMSRHNACWRWLKDNEPGSTWYPNARVFAQPVLGDWDTVVRAVGDALGAFEDARNRRAGAG